LEDLPQNQKESSAESHIEVRNKKWKPSLKIRRETKEQLLPSLREYKERKDVVVLGKSKNGIMTKISDL